MYKTLHKKQGSVTVQLRFARSSVTFCAKRDTREELLLYIDMFRRCDLMEKIAYCTDPEKKRTERTDEQQAAKTEKSPEKL